MKFNILKTRQGRLTEKIKLELSKPQPNLDIILKYVNDFEKENLKTIEKLKKQKSVEAKKINGALRQTINAHGPITKELIGSASKRILGSLMVNTIDKKETLTQKILTWLKVGILSKKQ